MDLKKPITIYNENSFKYLCLWDYFSSKLSVNQEDKDIRGNIFDFKNGNWNQELIENILEILKNSELIDKNNYLIIPIPAATEKRNTRRYEVFLKELSRQTKFENGFNVVKILVDRPPKHYINSNNVVKTPFNREAKHLAIEGKVIDNYIIETSLIKGKNIIVFDDVITAGTSFLLLAQELIREGAETVIGLFLGKTASYDEYKKKYETKAEYRPIDTDEKDRNRKEYIQNKILEKEYDKIEKSFYRNGNLEYEGFSKDKKKEKLWKYYHKNEILEKEGNFVNDKKEGIWKYYYENGNLKKEGSFKNDEAEGIWNFYYKTENLLLEKVVTIKGKEEKAEGICTVYYDTGELKQEGEYKAGLKIGVWKTYNKNGSLEREEEFK